MGASLGGGLPALFLSTRVAIAGVKFGHRLAGETVAYERRVRPGAHLTRGGGPSAG